MKRDPEGVQETQGRGTSRRGARSNRWLCYLLVLWWGCALSACGKKAEVDEDSSVGVGGTGAEPPGDGDGSDDPTASCQPLGGFRCNPVVPEQLEVCDPTTVAGWIYVETCGSAELCDAELGQCRACQPDSYRCDAWRLQACTANGSDWTMLTECDSAEFCDSRNAQCAECLPGSGYCDGSTLYSCNRNQDGFTSRDCGSPDNCSANSMSCRPCIPGEYQCNRKDLQICNDSRKWEVLDTCETAQLCTLSFEKLISGTSAEAACEPPVCESGEFKCGESDGRELFGCPPSRAEWQLIQRCDTADRCQADLGMCSDGPCLPGDMQCDGIAFQVCNSSGTAWETVKTCANEHQCNVQAGDCVACEPGDVQCNGRLLQQCNQDQEWVTQQTCASARLCTYDEADPADSFCAPPQCAQPGESYRCNQAELQVCNADLVWETAQSCATAGLCNAMDGRCNPPGCNAPGEHRCQNNVLELCPQDLTGWTPLEECAPGSTCDLASLGCVENCPNQRFRCNGTQPEECMELDDGTIEWQLVTAPCATQGLCWASSDGAGCNFPECGGFFLPDYRCNPDNPLRVEKCNAARTGWELALSCSSGTTCDPGPNSDGPPQCDICTPNNFTCENGILSQCEPSGQNIRILENCGDQAHCVDPPSGSQGYCLRCDAGQTQCNGSNLDTCSQDRRGWVQAEQCAPEDCHDNPGSQDYCEVCQIPGEKRCEGSSTLLTCTAAQDAWSGSTSCMFGCQDAGLSDYCRSCAPNTAQCSESESDERRVCSDAGQWQNFQTCPDGSDCFDAPGDGDYCGSCDPGSTVCINQTQIQECGNDGRPGELRNCTGATPVCLGSVNACVECRPGTTECSSSGRRTCGSDGFWDANRCESGKVCLNGSCVDCSPGAERCTGGSQGGRQVCSASGVWETRNCTSSDAPFCFEGSCNECTSTSRPRCTGSNMPGREICEGGQWSTDNCSQSEVCVQGECLECDPAAGAQCTGSSGSSGRRVCQSGEWVRADCSGSTPVCQSGACRCEANATRCSSTSGERQRCTSGMWVDDECASGVCVEGDCAECGDDDDCPNADFPVCEDGACTCDLGDERCAGAAHQICANTSGGPAWTSDACEGDTPLCQGDECVCSAGTTRCQGGSLQTCSMGSWTNSPGTDCVSCVDSGDCQNPEPLCVSGICRPCSSSGNNCVASVCVGGSCVECSSSNTMNCEEGQVCVENECSPCSSEVPCSGGLVCVGGSCQMGECSDGAQRCSQGIHQICDDGQWENDPCENPEPVCGAGGACEPCTDNGQCGMDGTCSGGSCESVECTPEDASECPEDAPVCSNNSCVQCTPGESGACGQSTPICVQNTCVACENGSERCADSGHELCVDNAWAADPCASGLICDAATNRCIEDSDSPGAGGAQ